MDKTQSKKASGKIEPRSREELSREVRNDLARDIEGAIANVRTMYEAASKWLAIEEFVKQSAGPVSIVIEEAGPIIGRRRIVGHFADHDNTKEQGFIDDFADNIMTAIAVENEARSVERARRGKRP